MTGNKCLLDTCVIVHSFKKANNVAEKLDALEEIYVSATVVGELYYGAYKSGNPVKQVTQVQAFLANCKILRVDSTTAEVYGTIKNCISKKGEANT